MRTVDAIHSFFCALVFASIGILACADDGSSASTAPTDTSTSNTSTSNTGTSGTSGSSLDGSGGSTGTSGDGDPSATGETTGDQSGTCQEACEIDEDCLVEGVDEGYQCLDARCRLGTPDQCFDDEFCQLVFTSGGFCQAPEDCMFGTVCVAVSGWPEWGKCTYADEDGDGECLGNLEPLTLPLFDGSGDVDACVIPFLECNPGAPDNALGCVQVQTCDADQDCDPSYGAPVCNDQGRCVCTEDAHCMDPTAPTCVEGRCRCSSDEHCAGSSNADVCIDGTCGCSSADACKGPGAFDGTELVCESI